MTPKQADQIIDYLYGMHRPPDQDATRRAWRMQLSQLDPDIASNACINGMQVWTRFPAWSDFFTEYKTLLNKLTPASVADCSTCGGDLFVVVSTRRPEQTDWMRRRDISPTSEPFEEVAPCPSCMHGVNTTFYRADGREVSCPDPEKVRRMMNS